MYILRRQEFRPALRPAVLTGLLGYIGRPGTAGSRPGPARPLLPLSDLLEPALAAVRDLLVHPAIHRAPGSRSARRSSRSCTGRNGPTRSTTSSCPLAIAAVTLSSLHQSTLGTLYLNMPHRLDALWYTPILPVLFFVSAVMIGLSMGALGYRVATRVRGSRRSSGLQRAGARCRLGWRSCTWPSSSGTGWWRAS